MEPGSYMASTAPTCAGSARFQLSVPSEEMGAAWGHPPARPARRAGPRRRCR